MKVHILICIVLVYLPALPARSERSRKVLVHYLPWYDSNGTRYAPRTGWCYHSEGTNDCANGATLHYSHTPLIGEYSLFDEDVLEYHLLLIHAAGIDGIILNINPASAMQRDASLALLDKIAMLHARHAPAFNVRVAISYDDGGAAAAGDIPELMRWTVDNVYRHETYASLMFHDDEREVPVYVVWSESNRALYWSVLNELFDGNVTVLSRNAVGFEFSTGNFEWVNYLNQAPPKDDGDNWGQQYFNDMDWIMARQSEMGVPLDTVNNLKMGNVYPGFDDVNVPAFWNGGQNRYILRDVSEGATMNLTWEKQISYRPQRLGGPDAVENPWVQIVTWNDWPEGTSIEPATDSSYGYKAIEICQQHIPRFKGIAARYGKECLRVPYHIYVLRKAGQVSEADQTVSNLLESNCNLSIFSEMSIN